jgi:circadian clock protein KaiC
MHLSIIHKRISEVKPSVCIFDPITNLLASAGTELEVSSMLTRLIDFLKSRSITAFFTSLTTGGQSKETSDVGVSSVMDTWLLLRDLETNGERNRIIYILKSRGMNHSNQVREFLVTSKGIDLIDVYLGPAGMLTGSARVAQEAREAAENALREQTSLKRERDVLRKGAFVDAQITALRAELDAARDENERFAAEEKLRTQSLLADRTAMAKSRHVRSKSIGGSRK